MQRYLVKHYPNSKNVKDSVVLLANGLSAKNYKLIFPNSKLTYDDIVLLQDKLTLVKFKQTVSIIPLKLNREDKTKLLKNNRWNLTW